MKKIFRKLACCSFLSIASIGCFDAEARVTKEVAEVTLPYLMAAAGIEEDPRPATVPASATPYYAPEKREAIINMIYTDDGQREMVKWVQDGTFPQKLDGAGFKSAETYKDKAYRDASLASLFPCSTGTFTSFANHQSRFGHAVLTKYSAIQDQLSQWIISGNGIKDKQYESIVSVSNGALDYKIARIIFILDIFDDPQQIYDVCVNGFKKKRISEALAGVSDYTPLDKDAVFSIVMLTIDQSLNDESKKKSIDDKFWTELKKKNKQTTQSGAVDFRRKVIPDEQIEQILTDIKVYSQQLIDRASALTANQEYTCRPVSAIIANKEGDCVETLYRHLINIAIQDDKELGTLHYSRLPVPLQKYYNKDLSGDDVEIKNMSESGASCVRTHERWKQTLKEIAEHGCFFGISSASIINLARTLHYIAFWHEDRTILNLRADTPLEEIATFIQAAMNKLANADGRFAVKLVNNVEDSTLPWVSAVVKIDDTKLKRLIKVGICNKRNANFGHAEIISISKQ